MPKKLKPARFSLNAEIEKIFMAKIKHLTGIPMSGSGPICFNKVDNQAGLEFPLFTQTVFFPQGI